MCRTTLSKFLSSSSIKVKKNSEPAKTTSYLINTGNLQTILENKILEGHIVEESYSPWESPMVLISKNGSVRVDCRKLNAFTTPDGYTLPQIDDLLQHVKSKMFYVND